MTIFNVFVDATIRKVCFPIFFNNCNWRPFKDDISALRGGRVGVSQLLILLMGGGGGIGWGGQPNTDMLT